MSTSAKYVVGIDFGTLSGRAAVVSVADGQELGHGVKEYGHQVMDRALTAGDGQALPPDFALQVPADYIEVLQTAVPEAVKASGVDPAQIVGIGIDFTSATVVAAKADGTPLCELPEFTNRPHAYVKLWKHHGGVAQAERIVEVAKQRGETWLSRYGGTLSSEMLMPKILETLEKDPEVYAATDVFCEAMDWITWQMTGTLNFAAGSSGYKRNYQDGSYPSREFLEAVNPDFGGAFEEKQRGEVLPLGSETGKLNATAAGWMGLPEGISVCIGNIDAHVTAAAVQAVEAGQMTAIMGTSSVQIALGEQLKEVPGMFGAVDGGIVDGLWAFECGQTAVGDIFAWFVNNCVNERYRRAADEAGVSIHDWLTRLAADQEIGEHGLIALDWHNGNRSILNDANLSALIIGQTLGTRPEDTYRALLEATAFGTRTILDTFRKNGVEITEIVAAGGLIKNKFLMQMYADVCKVPISVGLTAQPGALGSAVFAAVAAGVYPDVKAATMAMGSRQQNAYVPNPEASALYDKLYYEYSLLHDVFGKGGSSMMYRLKDLRRDGVQRRAARSEGRYTELDTSHEQIAEGGKDYFPVA
ncbi:ribulokinase [Luteococcus sp. H138]|uniref:ribulokinase n=1 Tax=unclassified Luteococcus TaxID=2639923 RepID=UPI00313E9A74